MPNCRPKPSGSNRALALLGILLLTGACARGVHGPAAGSGGEGRDETAGHRLEDIHPQVYTRNGEVLLFLCRWSTEAPIPVSVPVDASPEERRAIDDVLRAIEDAGFGVRFVEIEGTRTAITIEFYDEAIPTPAGLDAGNTVSDCRVREDPVPPGATRVGAELVAAMVRVARISGPDWRGEPHRLDPAELRGVLLHELGHALGFSGHARRGATVMVKEVDALRRAGARLLAGEPLRDPTLLALYRRPNGTILGRHRVETWRTDRVDRMTALAQGHALDGPFLRTGETRTRIYWSDRRGLEYGLVLVNLVDTLRDPATALVAPEARTRRALPRSRDRGPEPETH